MAALTEPWSKRHKAVTRNDREGLQYNLSNSFAQPTTQSELERFAMERGDDDLIAAYRDHPLGYTPNGGSQDCRAAVADAIFSACQADDVLITAGGQVAIQTVAFALLEAVTSSTRGQETPRSHAVVFTPSYQSCQEAPLHAGAAVRKVQLTRANGWDIDLTDLEIACRADTKLILINQPWNPAGTLVSREKLDAIVEIARRHNAWILADEIYRFLEHDAGDRLPAVADLYEKGVSIGALSKPFGAGGASLGWIACRDAEARQAFKDAMYFGTACPARASELQAIMVLRARDVLLERNLGIIRRNLEIVERFLQANSDLFSYVKPTAGCVLWVEFKGPLTSTELGAALAEAGISMKPSYCFTPDPDDGVDQYFRIGFGEEKVPAAIEALARFVAAKRDEWGFPRV